MTRRYAIHTVFRVVRIEANYPARRILSFNKLGGAWNSKIETVAMDQPGVLSLIHLIFSYVCNVPSG